MSLYAVVVLNPSFVMTVQMCTDVQCESCDEMVDNHRSYVQFPHSSGVHLSIKLVFIARGFTVLINYESICLCSAAAESCFQ